MIVKSDPSVQKKFISYPDHVRERLQNLRQLIMETAAEIEGIDILEETLKWGEPSYLVKKGSTIRIDWKARTPDQYAIYFKCTSKLVETFQHLYHDLFRFEGKRAILFDLDAPVPEAELKFCVSLALRYHHLKHLEWLGTAGNIERTSYEHEKHEE